MRCAPTPRGLKQRTAETHHLDYYATKEWCCPKCELTMNFSKTRFFPENSAIFLTAVKFPDISRFSRQVAIYTQQFVFYACSLDILHSFRYNDAGKENIMDHEYLFHIYDATSCVILGIFMQFIIIKLDKISYRDLQRNE